MSGPWAVRTRRTTAVLATTAGLVLTLGSPPAMATVSTTPDVTDKVGGNVHAIALVDPDGNPATPDAKAYIGGIFNAVGGKPRGNAALINANGRVDLGFTPATNGIVKAVAVSQDNSVVFLGGKFTQVNGVARANLAAVDAVTGQVLSGWQADTGGEYPDVNSLAVRGGTLYVGGRYATIDGTGRKMLTAVDAVTGNVLRTFNAAPNGLVNEVVVSPDGSTVYAGGAFTMLGGQARAYAGGVDAVTGAATAFKPAAEGGRAVTVEISPDGSRFFYATENNTLFAYDPAVSNSPVWTIKTSGDTQAIEVLDGEMWIGGHFSQVVTTHTPRAFLASLDPANGSVLPWDPKCYGGSFGVWALAHDGQRLHAGGVFAGFGDVKQRGYARFSNVS